MGWNFGFVECKLKMSGDHSCGNGVLCLSVGSVGIQQQDTSLTSSEGMLRACLHTLGQVDQPGLTVETQSSNV